MAPPSLQKRKADAISASSAAQEASGQVPAPSLTAPIQGSDSPRLRQGNQRSTRLRINRDPRLSAQAFEHLQRILGPMQGVVTEAASDMTPPMSFTSTVQGSGNHSPQVDGSSDSYATPEEDVDMSDDDEESETDGSNSSAYSDVDGEDREASGDSDENESSDGSEEGKDDDEDQISTHSSDSVPGGSLPSASAATLQSGQLHVPQENESTSQQPQAIGAPPVSGLKVPDSWRTAARAPAGERKAALINAISQSVEEFIVNEANFSRPHPAKSTFSFLSLPRELRDQVYRHLYVHNEAITIKQEKFHRAAQAHPLKPLAFARTNKQVYAEAIEVFTVENDFVLDLNILTAIDFLSAMPAAVSSKMQSITLGKAIMSGYVRYELGMFDSSRLRTDLVKRLVYDFNLHTISIEVPDEHNPNTQNNGNNGFGAAGAAAGLAANPFNFNVFHPRNDYSWALMKELVDVLLESGFESLRLVYNTPIHYDLEAQPKKLLNLYAMSRILYLDDEFEVETQVKRIEQARLAGRRSEFRDRKAVEQHVRRNRAMRQFRIGPGKRKIWESGSVIEMRKTVETRLPGVVGSPAKDADGLWETKQLMLMAGPAPQDNLVL